MRPALKKALHLSGHGLAIAGILFVSLRISDYYSTLDTPGLGPLAWFIVGCTLLGYGAANIPLALAWRQLLHHYHGDTARGLTIRIYGQSQLAKYVPGNIMHLASRQAIGVANGIPGRALAGSMAWELALIAVTGALFGILTLPWLFPAVPMPAAIALFVVAVLTALFILKLKFGLHLAMAMAWQLLFLALSGLIFVTLLMLVHGDTFPLQQVILFAGAFILAWLIGLLTPGAPAGIGVREAVLLLFLDSVVGESSLLVAVLLSRMVTAGGDLAFYLLASVLPVPADTAASSTPKS